MNCAHNNKYTHTFNSYSFIMFDCNKHITKNSVSGASHKNDVHSTEPESQRSKVKMTT